LCRDYLACATVLARWQEAESSDARLRVEEYAQLLAELTQEIHSQLDGFEDTKKASSTEVCRQ
jgi:hypothetical protein